MAKGYHVRSISLPSRSHPSTLRVEDELNKFKTWEAAAATSTSSASICTGLSGLEDLYMAMDDLLNMPSTLQILSRPQSMRCVEDSLGGSVKILDVCGGSRDIMLQMKENVQSLQSAIRRRKGDLSVESSISQFTSLKKKMKKDAKKLMTTLKQTDNKMIEALPVSDEDNHHLSAVVRVLREAISVTMSVFQYLVSFLALPDSKSKGSRWSLVAKWMKKGVVACERNSESENELQSVDAALCSLGKYYPSESSNSDSEKIQAVLSKMEAFEKTIASMENRLERLNRRIIKSRASLLNLISH